MVEVLSTLSRRDAALWAEQKTQDAADILSSVKLNQDIDGLLAADDTEPWSTAQMTSARTLLTSLQKNHKIVE